MKKYRFVAGETLPKIKDTSVTFKRLDTKKVAEALGANPNRGIKVAHSSNPVTRFAMAPILFREFQSRGIDPKFESPKAKTALRKWCQSTSKTNGKSNRDKHSKISLGDKEWSRLEKLAGAAASSCFKPSAEQIARYFIAMVLDLSDEN